jgi:hypothetical protein
MAQNQPPSSTASIAAKLLAGAEATPEEPKTLAASVLGQGQASDKATATAARVLGGANATPEESKTLAAHVLVRR